MCGEDKLEVSRWKFEDQFTVCKSSHFHVLLFHIFSVSLPTSVLAENNQGLFFLKTVLPAS